MKKNSPQLPKVSFIIPTLNAERFLPKCLEAIRSQDYPQHLVEIIIADGGSTDMTLRIAKQNRARIIDNPEVLHEPGKSRASKVATGKILFFTDSDNILSNDHWIQAMVRPYIENPTMRIMGFLPPTIPPKQWNSFDRYMGYLSTDPFTWFIYRWAATPKTFAHLYTPIKKTENYAIYQFDPYHHPLIGLSQGFGTIASFKRNTQSNNDDILSGIRLIEQRGLVTYVPGAGIYHYHVSNIAEFIRKYTWRIRNNYRQQVRGMGLRHRGKYLNAIRKIRLMLFPFYALSLIFPLVDACILYRIYRDKVVFWHPTACLVISYLIIKETIFYIFSIRISQGAYGTR
jgi:glycosyltransferase involved in cell wall biosynthesis